MGNIHTVGPNEALIVSGKSPKEPKTRSETIRQSMSSEKMYKRYGE